MAPHHHLRVLLESLEDGTAPSPITVISPADARLGQTPLTQ
jgi:hypothetical protein